MNYLVLLFSFSVMNVLGDCASSQTDVLEQDTVGMGGAARRCLGWLLPPFLEQLPRVSVLSISGRCWGYNGESRN